MSFKRNIIIISSYILLVSLLFGAGYFAGVHASLKTSPTAEETSAWVDDSEEIPYYTVRLQNSNILLCKHYMGSTELIYVNSIMPQIYPSDDIEELKKGIRFDSLDEAQSLIENFVS